MHVFLNNKHALQNSFQLGLVSRKANEVGNGINEQKRIHVKESINMIEHGKPAE